MKPTLLHRDWTSEEASFLQQNYGELRIEQIANVLGRTPNSVRQQASKLRIKFVDKTSFRECLYCKKNFSPQTRRQRYCSHACRDKFYYVKFRNMYLAKAKRRYLKFKDDPSWREAKVWRRRIYRLNKGRENKEVIVKLLGGRCSRCGYNRSLHALDLHERVKFLDKRPTFYLRSSRNNFAKLVSNIDKLELVCRNCHTELHDNGDVPLGLNRKYQGDVSYLK